MYFRLYLEFTIIRINLKCGIKKNDYLDIYFIVIIIIAIRIIIIEEIVIILIIIFMDIFIDKY